MTDHAVDEVSRAPTAAVHTRRSGVRVMRRPWFLVGVVLSTWWVLCASVPGLLTSRDPEEPVRLADGSPLPMQSPNTGAWWGTDDFGRDVYSRVVHGARPLLLVAPIAAAGALAIGALLWVLMQSRRGIGSAVGYVLDAVVSIPTILFGAMALMLFGHTRPIVALTLALLFAPAVTKRMSTTGRSPVRTPPRRAVATEYLWLVSQIVIVTSTLAFLGLNAGDPAAVDWGLDVNRTFPFLQSHQWWPATFPALAIASLAAAVHLTAHFAGSVPGGSDRTVHERVGQRDDGRDGSADGEQRDEDEWDDDQRDDDQRGEEQCAGRRGDDQPGDDQPGDDQPGDDQRDDDLRDDDQRGDDQRGDDQREEQQDDGQRADGQRGDDQRGDDQRGDDQRGEEQDVGQRDDDSLEDR